MKASETIRIAVATDNGAVARHFGRCPEYTIFEVRDGKVVRRTVVSNPGHEPGFLPRFLGEMGISAILAGGMGPRAQALFEQQGIRAVVGLEGPVDRAVETYLRGVLPDGDNACQHLYEPGRPHCHHDGHLHGWQGGSA